VIRRAVEGLDDRLGAASFARRALRKAFPDHWAFMLGEIALYCFVILVLTGTFLTFFYVASTETVRYTGPYAPLHGREMSAAYASVLRISYEVRAGLVMRQIHHWAAVVFVAAIVAHVLRVYFTGAFRRPREINWLIGVTLLLAGMGAGFTGYSLPDDLLSGTGIRIAYSVLLSIPVIGTWAAFLVFGGEFPTSDFLGRLFVLHVMLIPAILAGAITVHLLLVWHQKHTQFRAPGRTEGTVSGSPFWPIYAMKSAGLALVVAGVLAALGGLVQINAVWLYGPFDPSAVSSPAQPDWYLGWLEGALRLAPNWEIHLFGHTIAEPFLPGVVVPGLFFTILAAWPFIERRITKDDRPHNLLDKPRDAPLRSGVGAAGLTFMTILTFMGSNDVLSTLFNVPVETIDRIARVLILALPILLGYATYRLCLGLQRGDDHPVTAPVRVRIRRSASGGFETEPDRIEISPAALAHQTHHGDGEAEQPEDQQRRTVDEPAEEQD
jgi:ubiquinol-cytochrome c reductase cytochrome b subunit